MRTSNGARIISVCDDRHLASSRELLLQNEGYDVESVYSFADLTGWSTTRFQLAVLCHTVRERDLPRLVGELRTVFPEIRILAITPPAAACYCGLDAVCDPDEGPSRFLSAVHSLLDHGEISFGQVDAARTR